MKKSYSKQQFAISFEKSLVMQYFLPPADLRMLKNLNKRRKMNMKDTVC